MNEKTFQLMSLQYELAMQMGASLDLDAMLAGVLETLMQRLECRSAAVVGPWDARGRARALQSLPAGWVPEIAPPISPRAGTDGLPPPPSAPWNGVHRRERDGRGPGESHGGEEGYGPGPSWESPSPPDPSGMEVHLLEGGGARYYFRLREIGHLVLERSEAGLDPLVSRALLPLMDRLARSARACLDHERVQAAEGRFRALVQTLPEVVFEARPTSDQRLAFDYVSPRAEEVLGLSPAALVADPSALERLIAEEDVKQWRAVVAAALRDRGPFECRLRGQGSRAECRWWLVAASPGAAPGAAWSGIIQDVTARERVAASRQDSLSAQIETLLSSVGDAVVGADEDGRITLWNRGAERLFGHPLEAIIDQPLSTLVPSRLQEAHATGFERHRRLGVGRVMGVPTELPAIHAKGHELPVELMLSEVASGDDIRYIGVLRDLSARREAEVERLRQLQLLTSIWEAVPDLMFIVGTDGRIQYLQQRPSPDLVVPQDEIRGRMIGELLPDDIAQRLMEAVDRATGSGETQSVEYSLELSHGRQSFEARLAPIDNTQVTALVRNVTHERERERLLMEERARLQTLVSSTSAIVYSATFPDFKVDYVSESAAMVLGFPTRRFLDEGFWLESLHPDDRERVITGLSGLETRGRHTHEYRHRHADGSYRWLRDEVRMLLDASGNPSGVIGASFDITERKKAEHRLARALELQRMVSAIATTAVSLASPEIDVGLESILRRVGEMCRASAVTIYRLDGDGVSVAHRWAIAGSPPRNTKMRVGSLQDSDEMKFLMKGESVIVSNTSSTEHGQNPFRAAIGKGGVSAIIVTPMLRSSGLQGLCCVENPAFDTQDDLGDLVPPLRLASEAIEEAMRRAADERSLLALNARISRQVEQQKAMLDLSRAMATSSSNEEIYRLLLDRLGNVLGCARVSLMMFEAGRSSVRIRLLDAASDQRQVPGDTWVNHDLREVVVATEALHDKSVWVSLSAGETTSSVGATVEYPDWRYLREVHGLSHFVSVPLIGPDGIFGCVNASYSEAHSATREDEDWVRQVGTLLGAHLLAREARAAVEQVNRGLEERVEARTNQLKKSEERFHTLFQKAPQGMLLVDAAGRVVRNNARAGALLDAEGTGLAGMELRTLLPALGAGLGEAMAQSSLGSGQEAASSGDRSRTARAMRADGSEFHAEIGIVEIPDDGTTAHIVGITDISVRVEFEAALQRSLSEKETLLKEIHHRVKNNLQIISSLLMLQIERFPSDDTRAMMLEAVLRVRSMALIHQQLYGVESLDRVDLSDYARTLSESLKSALMPNVRVQVRAEPVPVTVHYAVPLGLILNEFMTNAIKYGLRTDPDAAGRTGPDVDVLVELSVDDGRLTMAVTDSGPGLPDSPGVGATGSLGLELVRALTRQLRGTLSFQSQMGARVAITCAISGGGVRT